jgi:hypothetical protein
MNNIKPGVQELFDSNPKLASIGTPQQYSAYLDSVFPDSKVKDIVYHGSDIMFDGFLEDNLNYFGTQAIAKGYGKNLYPTIIEINKPYYEDGGNLSNQSYEDLYDKLDESGSDGFISNGKNLFVPKTEEQIHILGNKQDVEGFRNFVETGVAEFKPTESGVFLQKTQKDYTPAQLELQQRLLTTKANIEKVEASLKNLKISLIKSPVSIFSMGRVVDIINISLESASSRASDSSVINFLSFCADSSSNVEATSGSEAMRLASNLGLRISGSIAFIACSPE